LAVIVQLVTPHKSLSTPAFATVGVEIITCISSELVQPGVEIEYLKVYVPAINPDAVAVDGVVTVKVAVFGTVPT
jgi:queuine/archaeosine tRNA-ribosyltransferase